MKEILRRHGREDDYIEISLDSWYRYNPLHNDLDAYALAYSIASLLNNLFGKGKEPFWQQAYTNVVKFIILLHKIAYDYVTLFDVYESAISDRYFVLVSPDEYMAHVTDLKLFEMAYDEATKMYRAKDTPGVRRFLETQSIEPEYLSEAGFDKIDTGRQELKAVKRWFYNDWRRIEPKLRTSIVEGISVFPSLFDDNPALKRTFCPPPECYDSKANADHRGFDGRDSIQDGPLEIELHHDPESLGEAGVHSDGEIETADLAVLDEPTERGERLAKT